MDAQTIINEMVERADNMTLCIGRKTLYWNLRDRKWFVYLGQYITPSSITYVGDDFWQAFAALCGATQHGVQPTCPQCGAIVPINWVECDQCGERG